MKYGIIFLEIYIMECVTVFFVVRNIIEWIDEAADEKTEK
jgi:hypothetical protein